MTRLLLAAALLAAFFLSPLPTAADARFARLSEPGIVAILRHAFAPGTGDPANFALDDCATQRNLDAQGRGQARKIAPEQWQLLERAAQGTPHSPNQILVELAMEALDRRDWPSTEVEMRVARASLFTAQAIALDLIAAGRENEVQEIRDFISTIVPDVEAELRPAEPSARRTGRDP